MHFLESIQKPYWIFHPPSSFVLSLTFPTQLLMLIPSSVLLSPTSPMPPLLLPSGSKVESKNHWMTTRQQGSVSGVYEITVVLLCPANDISDAVSIRS